MNRQLLLAFCLCAKGLLYALGADQYGYLADELYFLDAAAHPAFGYVDFPPLIAWLTAAIGLVFGDSLWALRGVAALVGVAVTWLAVEICRQLGGRIFALWVTALIVLFAPGYVSIQAIWTMNVFDQFWWLFSLWLLLKYLGGSGPRYMLAVGVALGFGIMSKLSILAMCLVLLPSLAIWYPQLLRRAEVWAAAGLAALIAVPFGIWQVANDYPFLAFIAAYSDSVPAALVLQNPIVGLFITMNPLFALVWLPGAFYALIAADRPLRLLGTIAWLCVGLFVLAGVKFYFIVPVFAVFIAAGALWWERQLTERPVVRAIVLITLLSGIASVPTAAPVLPIERLQSVADFIRDGQQGFPGTAPAELEPLFPHFAEMYGWPELVDATIQAFDQLPDRERSRVGLFAAYYGQAGALNRLDDEDRLPVAHSGHMSYDFWNQDFDFSDVLFVGFDVAELATMYGDTQVLAVFKCNRCMARENGLQIVRARQPAIPAAEIRSRLRRYYFF